MKNTIKTLMSNSYKLIGPFILLSIITVLALTEIVLWN